MSQVAIAESLDGKSVDWMEQVSEHNTCAPRVDRCQREKDHDMPKSHDFEVSRRDLMVGAAASAAVTAAPSVAGGQQAAAVPSLKVSFTVNGKARDLELDTRTTLLDALREACISRAPRRDATTASAAPAR